MLHKTRGIVINYVKYRETSIILKVYTERFGIQSYIENGVRSTKARNKIALFQPLTLLDLIVYFSDKKDIHRMKEIKCWKPYETLPYDVRKSSIALFINELLNKTLQEQTENSRLFEFLTTSLIQLDTMQEGIENFHLYFLVKYAAYLGFGPETVSEIERQLTEAGIPVSLDMLSRETLQNFLQATDFQLIIGLNRQQRNQLIDTLLHFYRLHVEDLSELKSINVLREVL